MSDVGLGLRGPGGPGKPPRYNGRFNKIAKTVGFQKDENTVMDVDTIMQQIRDIKSKQSMLGIFTAILKSPIYGYASILLLTFFNWLALANANDWISSKWATLAVYLPAMFLALGMAAIGIYSFLKGIKNQPMSINVHIVFLIVTFLMAIGIFVGRFRKIFFKSITKNYKRNTVDYIPIIVAVIKIMLTVYLGAQAFNLKFNRGGQVVQVNIFFTIIKSLLNVILSISAIKKAFDKNTFTIPKNQIKKTEEFIKNTF